GVCPDIEEHFAARQHANPSAVQSDLEGFWRDETPTAHNQFGAARLVVLQVPLNLTVHHLALALANCGHVDSDRICHDAMLSTVRCRVAPFGIRNLVLAGHAGDVGTETATPPPLHDGGSVP